MHYAVQYHSVTLYYTVLHSVRFVTFTEMEKMITFDFSS